MRWLGVYFPLWVFLLIPACRPASLMLRRNAPSHRPSSHGGAWIQHDQRTIRAGWRRVPLDRKLHPIRAVQEKARGGWPKFVESGFSVDGTSWTAQLGPGLLSYKSKLRDGSGFSEFPVGEDSYRRALAAYSLPCNTDRITDGVETRPHLGSLPSLGGKMFQRATVRDMETAVLEAKHQHSDDGPKLIMMDNLHQLMRPENQRKALEQVSEDQFEANRHLFVDKDGELLPLVAFWLVRSNGAEGQLNKSRAQLDPRWLFSFNGIPIGGPLGGAKRLVLVGSQEHERLLQPEVLATTVVDCVYLLTLPDVVVLAMRNKPLHEIGTWWYEHAVGIALYGPEKKLSLVETKPGKAGDGARWIYLYVLDAEYETCWTGPGYVVLLTMRGTFAGWRNLRKHDKTTGGMMAGPRWKLSTYQTRARKASETLKKKNKKKRRVDG